MIVEFRFQKSAVIIYRPKLINVDRTDRPIIFILYAVRIHPFSQAGPAGIGVVN
jgi:hypothetical protein